MPASYNRDELSFQYPDNWTLDEDPAKGIPRTVSITSEDGAFWSASIYPRDAGDLDELRNQFLQTLDAEYEDIEITNEIVKIAEQDHAVTDLQFYCLDFLVHSRLLVTEIGNHNVLICWQAEDRDFDELEKVFLAVTFTAISSAA